jgi:hypothetical protein
MARVYYSGLVDKIVGSIRGTIFQNNTSGTICRGKMRGKLTTTLEQNQKNITFANLSYHWSNLSLDNKILWNDFAAINEHSDIYGNARKVNGYNWFQCINNYLILAEENIFETPPSYELPSEAPLYNLSVSKEALILDIDTPEAADDRGILIFAGPPTLRASNLNTTSLKLIKWYAPATFDTLDISEDYINVFPLDYQNLDSEDKFNIQVLIVPISLNSYINGVGRKLIKDYVYIEPFNPSFIANMLAWHESDKQVTYDGSNLISQWNDLSGNNNHWKQNDNNYKPSYIAEDLNDLPAIDYKKTYSILKTDSIPNTCNNPVFQCFVLFNNTTSYGAQNIVENYSNGFYQLYIWPGEATENIRLQDPYANLKGNCSFPLNYCVIFALWNGTGCKIWLNNVLIKEGTMTDRLFSGNMILGYSYANQGRQFIGKYYMDCFYNTEPTSDERTDLYNYILTKYQL